MSIQIKKISSSATYPIRHRVLRPGKPLESCYFDGDDLTSTLHWGAFENDTLIGVASVFKTSHPDFPETTQYQLRGMAVLDTWQGKGIGHCLLEMIEKDLGEAAVGLWFNARSHAVPFYEKMAYIRMGSEFQIPDVGPHYVMTKKR